MSDADDVLAHSEDEGEWDDEPVVVERRPSGSQVLSARIPSPLAQRVFAEAARRNTTMSEIVRFAIEAYFHPAVYHLVVNVFPGERVSVHRRPREYETVNPVAEVALRAPA